MVVNTCAIPVHTAVFLRGWKSSCSLRCSDLHLVPNSKVTIVLHEPCKRLYSLSFLSRDVSEFLHLCSHLCVSQNTHWSGRGREPLQLYPKPSPAFSKHGSRVCLHPCRKVVSIGFCCVTNNLKNIEAWNNNHLLNNLWLGNLGYREILTLLGSLMWLGGCGLKRRASQCLCLQ